MTAQKRETITKWIPTAFTLAGLIWGSATIAQQIKDTTKCTVKNELAIVDSAKCINARIDRTDAKMEEMVKNVNTLCVQMAEVVTELRLSRGKR